MTDRGRIAAFLRETASIRRDTATAVRRDPDMFEGLTVEGEEAAAVALDDAAEAIEARLLATVGQEDEAAMLRREVARLREELDEQAARLRQARALLALADDERAKLAAQMRELRKADQSGLP